MKGHTDSFYEQKDFNRRLIFGNNVNPAENIIKLWQQVQYLVS